MGCYSSVTTTLLIGLLLVNFHFQCSSCFLFEQQEIASFLSFGRVVSSPTSRARYLRVVELAAAAKSLSAADRERREEEKRRRERAGDVVIGKTSAIKDARDYAFEISATQEEWMRQASKVEREVWLQTERGMQHLSMLQLYVPCKHIQIDSRHRLLL
jgi:hypothetical protein